MSIHVRTPSRLHFGLLALGEGHGRQFGGAGLMVDSPGIELRAELADQNAVTGDVPPALIERAKQILERIHQQLGLSASPIAVELINAASEHAGLGTGTQLSLALALAACKLNGRSPDTEELTRLTGRGKRSAIGVHGFQRGGFLVDGGKGSETTVAPLISRLDFPIEWPILLIHPDLPAGIHGELEKQAFSGQLAIPHATTERLSRLLLLNVLPAIVEANYPVFGESLHEYNRLVGDCFAGAQGGPYAGELLSAIVDAVRGWEVPAVGQSSWGPTLFVVAPELDLAGWLADRLVERFQLSQDRLTLTTANSHGAIAWEESDAG